jgi:hypothetical protein
VYYASELALFFRDTLKVRRIFDCFHDIRSHPRIRLKDILVSVFLMPYWGLTALLRLDFHLRTPQMLRLFRCPQQKCGFRKLCPVNSGNYVRFWW